MPTITIRDQATSGPPPTTTGVLTLDILTEELTIRELIRARIYQEVQDFNLKRLKDAATPYRGLVQPTDAEITINGYLLNNPRQIDWKQQFDKACAAFEANRILVLVDDHQAADLEERITVRPETEVTFLRLTPLVGG